MGTLDNMSKTSHSSGIYSNVLHVWFALFLIFNRSVNMILFDLFNLYFTLS